MATAVSYRLKNINYQIGGRQISLDWCLCRHFTAAHRISHPPYTSCAVIVNIPNQTYVLVYNEFK